MDRVPPSPLAPVLAEQLAGRRIEEADVVVVPLHGDHAPEPARRRGVVGAGDLDAAVQVHGAGPVLVVAKGLQGQGPQVWPLLEETKPGHGGVLPAAKVSPEIAAARGVPVGVDCVSPARHSAFSTPRELAQFIGRLRDECLMGPRHSGRWRRIAEDVARLLAPLL